MFGKGSGFRFSWNRRGGKRAIARLVEALNARRYGDMEQLLAPDFTYLDTMSNAIDGPRAFVAAAERLRIAAPDLQVELDGISESSGVLLMRGRILSSDPEFCSDSLWSARVEGRRIRELQAFRDNNAISLLNYSA